MSNLLTSTTSQIKEAIADNLRANIQGMQILGYVRDQVIPPAADVRRGTVDYDQAMQGGVHHWIMYVRVFVAGITDQGAQAQLDSYLDPDGVNSVKAAIESDPQLGGLIADLHVTQATGEQTYTMGGSQMLGSEWTVEIWL
jgi:hypothetical protein